LFAAGVTANGKEPHSFHAYFVEAGTPDRPMELSVERVRDGRSFSTRRVNVLQDGRTLLTALASFHFGPSSPERSDPAPAAPAPESVPRLQDWARALPAERREHGRSWLERPPPLDLRIGEPPTFLGGRSADGGRTHWMRLPREVGDDPLLHATLLAYASDYLLLDMVPRSHPEPTTLEGYTGFSLDHALWFHRPVRFDRWHLHSQHTRAIAGHRGLVGGAIHDDAGRLVASVMQEVLVRPVSPR
jgi:acyl-CoA thioesterase-2